MSYFHVHPDDARWLRRWLRCNVTCCLVILAFIAVIRIDPFASPTTMTPVRADGVAPSGDLLSETLQMKSHHPNAVSPEGWRRTSRGWEHVSSWAPPPRPLHEIIKQQQSHEPRWMRFALGKIRDLPPLMFALMQITSIAVVVNLAKSQPRRTASSSVLAAGRSLNVVD